jgi:hypothetical protein
VAGDSGDEVLQLEEGKREVREHLAEEKVARGSSSNGWGGGGGGATKCDNFRGFSGDGDGRGAMRAGDTQVVLKKEGKWERKGGGGGDNADVSVLNPA